MLTAEPTSRKDRSTQAVPIRVQTEIPTTLYSDEIPLHVAAERGAIVVVDHRLLELPLCVSDDPGRVREEVIGPVQVRIPIAAH
jgi:hypothetical protein